MTTDVEIDIEKVKNTLKKLFQEQELACISTPVYMRPFFPSREIVFIYKNKEQSTSSIGTYEMSSFNSTTDGLDLTGQPLECPFDTNETYEPTMTVITSKPREYDHHCPLSIQDARKIMSRINLSEHAFPPVYVLTNASDMKRTVVLGNERKGEWFSRSWISFDNDCGNTDVLDMLRKHKQLCTYANTPVLYEANCSYAMEDNKIFSRENSVELRLSWKDNSFLPPKRGTSAKIVIKRNLGWNSEFSKLRDQIILIRDYLSVIKEWKEAKNCGPYVKHSVHFPNINTAIDRGENDAECSGSRLSANERFSKLLEEPNAGCALRTWRFPENEAATKKLPAVMKEVIQGKYGQEFTDKLWNILIECSTYGELRSIFETMFKMMRNSEGRSTPYFQMKSGNITRLCHAANHCKIYPSSHLEMALEPLELLVEMGVEKLRKDYANAFLQSKIASLEQLRVPPLPKFVEIGAGEWLGKCCVWLRWLMNVHKALETAALAECSLNCPDSVVPIAAAALQYYTAAVVVDGTTDGDELDALPDPRTMELDPPFETAINVRDINDFMEKRIPFNNWSMKLTSELDGRIVRSIFHRTFDDLFPASSTALDDFSQQQLADDTTAAAAAAAGGVRYFGYNFHCIRDKLSRMEEEKNNKN